MSIVALIKARFSPSKPWQVEIQELHKSLVPMSGEAETLQGELVRSIQNLADECQRNGWTNWDEGDEESIQILKRYLVDPKIFSQSERALIESELDRIQYSGEEGADKGEFGYEEIKSIAEKVVRWCRKHPKPIVKDIGNTWLD